MESKEKKAGILWSFQCPLPLLFPLTSSITHLASRCSLYMFPYSSELLDTLSSTQANWHAQISSDMCTHPMHVTDLCTCRYISRGGAEWIGASVAAGQRAHWLGEGTYG